MSNLWHGELVISPSDLSQTNLGQAPQRIWSTSTPMLTAWQINRMKATEQLENHGLIAITETWWDKSPKCNAEIEGYTLFRRDKQGRRGERVALYLKKWIDSKELPLKNNHEQVESLWGKISHQTNKGHLVVGVFYRLLIKGSLLMRPSHFIDKKHCVHRISSCWGISTVGWENKAAGCKQSKRHASQDPEGAWGCGSQATLHHIQKVAGEVPWQEKGKCYCEF